MLKADLHVVTAISNPVRYRSRYALYRQVAKRITDGGAILWTIELALGDRPFMVTEDDNPRHIRVRSPFELWHKENLLNIAISRLPLDARYIAWIDADIQFARPDWVTETIEQLQHHDIVQMFSHAQDVGPNYEPNGTPHVGFMYSFVHGLLHGEPHTYSAHAHPGYAWAGRREALDRLGGLVDWAILGSADTHMALALIGEEPINPTMPLSAAYKRRTQIWKNRADELIQKNVGYVAGTLNHFWHGKKRDRKYRDRWQILVQAGYDPDLDIKLDSQGVLQLTPGNLKLRDGIREYMRLRNEDSIDT
jgi:hypothetical protein